MVLLSLVITAVWVVGWVAPTISEQNEKIASIEAGLEHQMQASDRRLYEQFKLLEANTTAEMKLIKSVIKDMQRRLETTEHELRYERDKNAELEKKIDENSDKISTFERQTEEIVGRMEESHQNVTSALQSKIEGLEEELARITASTMTIEDELRIAESSIETLNNTKASAETVNNQIGRLDREKVDRREFEVLSINLTLLAEDSSQMDEEIQQKLDELADSALNETHYHELHEAIARKASQIDLDTLASSTVRTSTFQERVESIQNSILQLQLNVSLNFTSLDVRIQHIDTTLLTKADQHDLTTLTTRVTNLEGSKVDKDTFQQLEDIVEGIQESKADKTYVNRLGGRVYDLERNTATKSELRSLDTKLSQHSSTSNGVHNRLSTDISGNSGGINSNSDRITTLESSSPGLSPSLLVIAVSVSLTLVRWASY